MADHLIAGHKYSESLNTRQVPNSNGPFQLDWALDNWTIGKPDKFAGFGMVGRLFCNINRRGSQKVNDL